VAVPLTRSGVLVPVRHTRAGSVRSAGKSRERLLAVAQCEFARRGLNGVPLMQVAAGAGVSKAMILYHFNSVLGLQRAVLDVCADRVHRTLERLTKGLCSLPTGERAAALVAGWSPLLRGSAAHILFEAEVVARHERVLGEATKRAAARLEPSWASLAVALGATDQGEMSGLVVAAVAKGAARAVVLPPESVMIALVEAAVGTTSRR
jgi:AcrR family transcriptional regulator